MKDVPKPILILTKKMPTQRQIRGRTFVAAVISSELAPKMTAEQMRAIQLTLSATAHIFGVSPDDLIVYV